MTTPAHPRPPEPAGPPVEIASPAFQRDPWPLYDWYRENRPVHYSASQQCWFVFGHAHVRRVMTSGDFTADHPFRTSRRAFGPTMLDHDGEAHTRLRSAAADSFRPRAAARYAQEVVAPLVDRLLGQTLERGRGDFVEVLARRLPMLVVCRVLGLPESDADALHTLMRPLVTYVDQGEVSLTEVTEARAELRDRLGRFAGGCPAGGGLLARLAADDTLSAREAVDSAVLLLAAGTETTTGALTNLLCRVAADPPLFARLREDREHVPAVVTETLRHEPPLHLTLRFAAHDVTLAGRPVPAGSAVQVVLASANRDPAVYSRPHTFDADRERRTSLTFGMGRHLCLGMGLANRELEIVLNGVLDRVEWLRLSRGELLPARGRTFRKVPHSECEFRPCAPGHPREAR